MSKKMGCVSSSSYHFKDCNVQIINSPRARVEMHAGSRTRGRSAPDAAGAASGGHAEGGAAAADAAPQCVAALQPVEEREAAVGRLAVYVGGMQSVEEWLAQLASCRRASELAVVAVAMMEAHPRAVTAALLVKREFIRLLLALADGLTDGRSDSNVRKQINKQLDMRPDGTTARQVRLLPGGRSGADGREG